MISLRIIIFSITILLVNTSFSQAEYLEKMPNVRTIENFKISYDKSGGIVKKLTYLDSFDVIGNLVLRKYPYGGGQFYEYLDDKVIERTINFPDCVSEVIITEVEDTILITRRLIESKCNWGPPLPPMRVEKNYDSLFINVPRIISNDSNNTSIIKIVNDDKINQRSYYVYQKSRSGRNRKPNLTLKSIEQETRISKHFMVNRFYVLVRDEIVLQRQEVRDNYGGKMRWNGFTRKYKKTYRYDFDKEKNWTIRKDREKKILALRTISYY